MAKKSKQLKMTYIGIVSSPTKDEVTILDNLMRRFCSAKRYARERIFEGKERKEAVESMKPLFFSNSRYMRDAFLEADASISSQRELLPLYIGQTEEKIGNVQNKIERVERWNCPTPAQRQNQTERLAYLRSKLKKLEKQQRYYQHHIGQGTVPKVVDGTKKRFQALQQGKLSIEEWRQSRRDSLYARGEKSKGGNENMKLSPTGDGMFTLRVLNALSSKKGERISLSVSFPSKFYSMLCTYLGTGEAYSIRLKKRNGRYEVHMTLEQKDVAVPSYDKGAAGMDVNPNNVSVTLVHPNGNFRTSRVFWMHDVTTIKADQRDTLINETLHTALSWVKAHGVDTLVVENLSFSQKSGNKTFNRMRHNFSYRAILNAVVTIAYKKQLALVEVDAHYSSVIGRMKYQQPYGLSVHQAAALVLARRGMGFHEKIPHALLSVLFAKEAKKGQKLTKLHTHWKKVKTWWDNLCKVRRKAKKPVNGLLLKDVLTE